MKKLLYFAFLSVFAFFGTITAETKTIDWMNTDGTNYAQTTCQTGGNLILTPTPTKPGYTFAGWKVHQETNE